MIMQVECKGQKASTDKRDRLPLHLPTKLKTNYYLKMKKIRNKMLSRNKNLSRR